MSVKKHTNRGKTTWCFMFDAPGSTREDRTRIRKFGFPTKKAAEEAEVLARMEAMKAECLAKPRATPFTLDLMFEKFFQLHCPGLSPKTTNGYRDDKTYLSPNLLAMAPGDIRRLDWTAEWVRLKAEGGRTRSGTPRPLSAGAVLHIAASVSACYGWGISQEFVEKNPVTGSERPKREKQEAVTVSRSDYKLLLENAAGFWCIRPLIATADGMGVRRGELCAHRWSDWREGRFTVSRSLAEFEDPKTGRATLQFKDTKGRNVRQLVVPKSLIPILEGHRQRQHELKRQWGPDYQDNDLIFCQEDGTPLWPDAVSRAISTECCRLGLPEGTSLHSLRHTHGSILLDQGVSLPEVSKRLGHANVRITAEVYAHKLGTRDDSAAQAYDDYHEKQKEQDHAVLVQ